MRSIGTEVAQLGDVVELVVGDRRSLERAVDDHRPGLGRASASIRWVSMSSSTQAASSAEIGAEPVSAEMYRPPRTSVRSSARIASGSAPVRARRLSYSACSSSHTRGTKLSCVGGPVRGPRDGGEVGRRREVRGAAGAQGGVEHRPPARVAHREVVQRDGRKGEPALDERGSQYRPRDRREPVRAASLPSGCRCSPRCR